MLDARSETSETVKSVAPPARAAIATDLAAGYSPTFRKVEIASIVLFALLVARAAYAILNAPEFSWMLVLGAWIAGWLLADFMSGLVHWFADTWGSATMPVLGPTLIRSFREHHVDPMSITRHDFVETNGASCLVCLPILGAINFLNFGGASPTVLFAAATLASLSFWTLMTNQAHQWAHQGGRASRTVRMLQRVWLILPSPRHAEHHRAPFVESYCITNGWLNPLLNRLGFFRGLESVITAATGAIPREEDRRLTQTA